MRGNGRTRGIFDQSGPQVAQLSLVTAGAGETAAEGVSDIGVAGIATGAGVGVGAATFADGTPPDTGGGVWAGRTTTSGAGRTGMANI